MVWAPIFCHINLRYSLTSSLCNIKKGPILKWSRCFKILCSTIWQQRRTKEATSSNLWLRIAASSHLAKDQVRQIKYMHVADVLRYYTAQNSEAIYHPESSISFHSANFKNLLRSWKSTNLKAAADWLEGHQNSWSKIRPEISLSCDSFTYSTQETNDKMALRFLRLAFSLAGLFLGR